MKKGLFFLLTLICLSFGSLYAVTDAHAGGGKSAPDVPPPPPPAPVPDTAPQETESAAVRNEERRRLRQKTGASGTVLAPLGQSGGDGQGDGQGGNTLLGRLGR